MKRMIWLRLFFLIVVLQALNIGRALIWPDQIVSNLPWPASPLNARFVASLYWMGAISAVLCMLARSYTEIRITVIEIGIVTGGLLVLTLPHLGEFTPATFPYFWLILYVIDPLLAAVIWWQLRTVAARPSRLNPLAPLLIPYAGLLGLLGLVLLIVPDIAARFWPWSLPAILSQVYSIFFLTFAIGGLLAVRELDWDAIRIYLQANLVMLILVIVVSVIHRDRFVAGPATWIWYSLCAIGILAFATALIRRPRALMAQGSVV